MSGQLEQPESIRIEIRMSDHTKVVELFPGDSGYPQLTADLDMNREPVEVPWEATGFASWRQFKPGPEVDITLKATAGKLTYAREERPDLTDREALEQLLRRFGLTPYSGGDPMVDAPTEGEVILQAHHGGVDGYNGFRAAFTFDDSGKFQHLGVWE